MDLTRFQSVLEAFEEDAFFMSSRSRRVRRPGIQTLAGDGVAGSRADVLEVELPGAVFLLGPAGDERSPFPEIPGSGENASLGGTRDDDLVPDFFHRALRHPRVLEARDPPAADFHGHL